MLTKQDFQQVIADSINSYPAIAPLYQVKDPRTMQNLEAMAAMLAVFSAQLETAAAEPFEKVRDSTVLADAAMRGVIKKAAPARVIISAKNNGNAPFVVETGRTVIDSSGLSYIIETAATVAASGGTGTFYATQVRHEAIAHTVSGNIPFYPIEIPAPSDDSYLCGISVSDSGGLYEYRERYVNTWPDERVFHVESDDRQRLYVRFGQTDIVGVQPADGQIINLTISRTAGEISITPGSNFAFEYLQSPIESSVELTLDQLVESGKNPPDMATLRDLVRYPSVYNHSAVFLGEFDFVVSRAYPDTRFLSVWNEAVEESVTH
ncbi:hypothetical protein [Nitrosomonas oligotropha]|uniref:hypothetical protein n=1 Tax=Nitrosomonas oligotropha TaxID=42354 RepID=UPI001370E632|nr:hypothetical protein [Nitrosomonas oligotropha]MXS83968.1 hypothetical protein [Nitrosomonas oligotropha]